MRYDREREEARRSGAPRVARRPRDSEGAAPRRSRRRDHVAARGGKPGRDADAAAQARGGCPPRPGRVERLGAGALAPRGHSPRAARRSRRRRQRGAVPGRRGEATAAAPRCARRHAQTSTPRGAAVRRARRALSGGGRRRPRRARLRRFAQPRVARGRPRYRSAASLSSPSIRWSKKRSVGPSDALAARSVSRYSRINARLGAVTFRITA